MSKPFSGAQIVSFESRQHEVMTKAIQNIGGEVLSAPSMQETPLSQTPEVLDFGKRLLAQEIDLLILMTGVGAKALFELLTQSYGEQAILTALRHTPILVRGPKPMAVMKQMGLPIAMLVPEPNTWREIVETIRTNLKGIKLEDSLVAIQEYGKSNPDLIKSLEANHARVMPVPIYKWALPDDTKPLEQAIHQIAARAVDVVLFTSGQQIVHVLEMAKALACEDALRLGLRKCVVASIGPICSETLQFHHIDIDFEPTRPKMGPFIQELASQFEALHQSKRSL